MQKVVIYLFLFLTTAVCASIHEEYSNSSVQDTLVFAQDGDIGKQRNFKDNLPSKYNGSDFTYKETTEKPPEVKEAKKIDRSTQDFLSGLFKFFATVFPYLLAIVVIYILVSVFVYDNKDFWKFKRPTKRETKKLVYEDDDENIDENDYEKLLARALQNNDYRLATRYYYLSVLKLMSHKKLIDYHKDKTNSQYLFELKDTDTRKQFSYLSYIYDYVWYGEFYVDQQKFTSIETSYKSFITKL